LVGYYFTEFLAGVLLLTWSFVNSRHLRNYAYVWFLGRKPDALKGRQEQSYWFMQKLLSSEALTFGLLCLFLTLLTWRIFFLAGALSCFSLALRAYRLANRKFKTAPAEQTLS
jgi:Flp pilus assembly protein TadB